MKHEDLVGLFNAYGFGEQSEQSDPYKTRFSGLGTFVDLWNGRKGITLGVYEPKTKRVWYRRGVRLEDIEEILIQINKKKTV